MREQSAVKFGHQGPPDCFAEFYPGMLGTLAAALAANAQFDKAS